MFEIMFGVILGIAAVLLGQDAHKQLAARKERKLQRAVAEAIALLDAGHDWGQDRKFIPIRHP